MPRDVTDLLTDGLNEVKIQIEAMRDQMHQEHKALGDRVGKLEYHEKITRYVFGGGAALITLALREVIPKIF